VTVGSVAETANGPIVAGVSPGTTRLAAALAVLVLAAAACSGADSEPSSTTPATGSSAVPAAMPIVVAAGAEDIVAESVVIPRIDPILGEAPLRLADHDPGVVGAVVYPATIPWDEPEPPSGLDFEIDSCERPAPGVLMIDGVVIADDSVTFPATVGVYGSVASDEFGTMIGADVTFDGPGSFSLVLTAVDSRAAMAAAGRTDFDFADRGTVVRAPIALRDGGQCSLETGSRERVTDEIPLVVNPGTLEVTAPAGTIESLAQEMSPEGDDAALYPLLVGYGEAVHFHSERWFLPAEPGELFRAAEWLYPGGCLELEMMYEGYTVVQRRNCALPARGGVFGAGSTWFAIATDGEWIVQVGAESEEEATEIAESLRPYWHLMHDPVLPVPIGEEVIGRAPFEDGEVLVTIANTKCDGCGKPWTWFHVYRIEGDEFEPFARYPAYRRCGLYEEDALVLAVAPRDGSIEIVRGGEVETITEFRDSPAFLFLENEAPATVRVLEPTGSIAVPQCVTDGIEDSRGGIEPFVVSEVPTPPRAATSREVIAQPCDGAVALPDLPLRSVVADACVETGFADFALFRVDIEPGPNETSQARRECLLTLRKGSLSSDTCSTTTTKPGVYIVRNPQRSWVSVLAPEGATRIVGITTAGTELIAVPHDRIGFLWWNDYEGELAHLTAETPSGDVVVYSSG